MWATKMLQKTPAKRNSDKYCYAPITKGLAQYMKRLTTEEFIAKAKDIHGDTYNYSLVEYKTAKTKVQIICNKHGLFTQTPNGHLNNWGCRRCGFEAMAGKCRRTKAQFVKQAQEIHGDLYDYSFVNYVNDHTKIIIGCSVHGKFEMAPTNHLYGKQGCRSCNMSASMQQTQWLDSLGIDVAFRNKKVVMHDGTYILADAVDNKKKIIYEYWGDYWHGNPNKYDKEYLNPHCKCTMGELYNLYLQKKKRIENSGYTLIDIWESDFARDAGKKV